MDLHIMIILCRYDTCKSMLSKRATASDKAWRGLAGRAELSAAVCAIYVLVLSFPVSSISSSFQTVLWLSRSMEFIIS